MNKKTIYILGLVILILALFCLLREIFDKTLHPRDLSIDDFVWKTSTTTKYNYEYYCFSLTNHSDYDIISVEVTYVVNDNVSDDKLKVYNSFMNKHQGWIKESASLKDVVLTGSKDTLVPKGGELTGLYLFVGIQDLTWNETPTKSQFELMELGKIQLGVVGKDNNLYIASYYFALDSWIIDDTVTPINTWTTKEIGQKISKPSEGYCITTKNEEDYFRASVFGVTAEGFSRYVKDVKKAGFVEETAYSSYFEGKNTEDYEVMVSYDSENCRMDIRISKES